MVAVGRVARLGCGEHFDTASKLARLERPMIFVHGTADQVVPVAMSKWLCRAARGDMQLVIVEGGGDKDALTAGAQRLADALVRLVRMCDGGI